MHPARRSPCMSRTGHDSQFALLAQRRFAPFFWTQFFGAGNDNLFKLAFTMLVTYQVEVDWLPPAQAGLVIGALFILPFLLFSATSGQLADKHDKARLMRWVKSFELAVMALACLGFYTSHIPLLLVCVFLMGLHSTLFGPVKYAYMPQHLTPHELTGGNGMVETGTFIAILVGSLAGGLLITAGEGGRVAALACLGLALAGRVTAHFIPPSPSAQPGLKINWNPLSETWRNLVLAHRQLALFRSLLGISWMWFFGAVFLANFPSFAHEVLHGDEHVASALLVVFSLGIGAGALTCEKASRGLVEIGLVPVGAIGMSVFAIDLYFAATALAPGDMMTLSQFMAVPANWRVLADLALLAFFAGLYSVPMYALIQVRAPVSHRARIIAANNILNALFIIASSVMAGVALRAGWTIPEVFLAVGLLNVAVALYIFLLVPEYLLRFFALLLTRIVYRFRVRNTDHIPVEGPALLVCNHVSFVDVILLLAASPRPIRFIMDNGIFRSRLLGWLFRLAKTIPIAPQKEDPVVYARAFEEARRVLDEGELVGIFPEGMLTKDGSLQPFRPGLMKLVEGRPDLPVVPLALHNLWGSFFSRIEGGRAMVRPFRRGLFSRVAVSADAPLRAADITPEALRERVEDLLRVPVERD
ncbi:MAG: MFS transporter [Burkholderiales bacterium]|nr:MFS transporter [Burkholderiales bacterium]